MEIATRILDRILPWRRRIRNLLWLVKRLNADCQELADKHKNLKLAYHDVVGSASLDHAAIPFYEKRIAELEEAAFVLSLLVETTGFREKFWQEYGDHHALIPVAKERRELLVRIEKVLKTFKKD